jgi:hypothetical protein
MAGAASPYNPDWDEDSDSDIPNLGLDEVGDTSIMSTCTGPVYQPLRNDNLHSTKGFKNYMEGCEER